MIKYILLITKKSKKPVSYTKVSSSKARATLLFLRKRLLRSKYTVRLVGKNVIKRLLKKTRGSRRKSKRRVVRRRIRRKRRRR